MEIRSFLAFELPPGIREIVSSVSDDFRHDINDVRWVRPGNIHLTVVFLGNICVDSIDGINEIVHDVCLKHDPFEIRLKGTGVFGSASVPRVLWLGLEGDIERMSYLKNGLQKKNEIIWGQGRKTVFQAASHLGKI